MGEDQIKGGFFLGVSGWRLQQNTLLPEKRQYPIPFQDNIILGGICLGLQAEPYQKGI